MNNSFLLPGKMEIDYFAIRSVSCFHILLYLFLDNAALSTINVPSSPQGKEKLSFQGIR